MGVLNLQLPMEQFSLEKKTLKTSRTTPLYWVHEKKTTLNWVEKAETRFHYKPPPQWEGNSNLELLPDPKVWTPRCATQPLRPAPKASPQYI